MIPGSSLATAKAGSLANGSPTQSFGIFAPANFTEAMEYAKILSTSGVVPKEYINNPGAILVAADMGMRIGLGFAQSLQCIAVINGRPTLWGDEMLALVRASGLLERIDEWHEGDGDDYTAWCEVVRKGDKPRRESFSVLDAKKAELWTKPGPWKTYPRRQQKMRARSWVLRDVFGDVLKGLYCAEEQMDAAEINVTPTPTPVAIDPSASRATQVRAMLGVSTEDVPEKLTLETATVSAVQTFAEVRKGLGKDALRAFMLNTTGGVRFTRGNLAKIVDALNALPDLKRVQPISETQAETVAQTQEEPPDEDLGSLDDAEPEFSDTSQESVGTVDIVSGEVLNAHNTTAKVPETAPITHQSHAVETRPEPIPEAPKPQAPIGIVPADVEDVRGMIQLPQIHLMCISANNAGLSRTDLRDIIKRATKGKELNNPTYDMVMEAIHGLIAHKNTQSSAST